MLDLTTLLLLPLATFFFAHVYTGWQAKRMSSASQSKNVENGEQSAGQPAEILFIMNEIDRAILSNASFERVIELVFLHAPKFIPCALIAVAPLDKSSTDHPDILVATPDGKHAAYPHELDKSLRQILDDNSDGYSLDRPEAYPSLTPLAELGAERILMFPIYREAELSAVLYYGFASNARISELIHRVARHFADRLGVALTSIMSAKHLHYQAHFDPVTALPNRRSCRERLSLEISRAQRNQLRMAVLYISLEGFKKINDAAGYAGGDSILKQVGQRFRSCLWESDFVARFGNTEFIAILPDVGTTTGISKAADKLIASLSQHFTYNEHLYHLSSSIGISVYPDDGKSVDTLLQNADTAMARVKAKGSGQFIFHEENVNSITKDRLSLERDLHLALQRDELYLLYQPQMDLRKGRIAGMEALIRWKHPTKGVISPIEFISIAEESDLIVQLGEYVRKAACTQYRKWEAQGIAPPRIALNVSSKEFMRNSFTADFQATLRETGVQPSSIEIEITESLLIDISGHVNASLQNFRQQGIHIAIDDFGTGYSSLSYLTQLPFDVLKIDQSFVREIGKPAGSDEIVSMIIDMAHHLSKIICAEGIENESQREFLKERGCEVVQGYLFSRPLSVEQFETFSAQWQGETVG